MGGGGCGCSRSPPVSTAGLETAVPSWTTFAIPGPGAAWHIKYAAAPMTANVSREPTTHPTRTNCTRRLFGSYGLLVSGSDIPLPTRSNRAGSIPIFTKYWPTESARRSDSAAL
jgi:hypothetical protein